MSRDAAWVPQIAARARLNILISGKTTLLNAISRYIDRDKRVITVEDAVDLRLQQSRIVQMEPRPPNVEGVGSGAERSRLTAVVRPSECTSTRQAGGQREKKPATKSARSETLERSRKGRSSQRLRSKPFGMR